MVDATASAAPTTLGAPLFAKIKSPTTVSTIPIVEMADSESFKNNTPPAAPAAAGAFVESFLGGGAEVLVQDRALLATLDLWLLELEEQSFIELLPMLRRGFADFSGTGRQRILGIVGSGNPLEQTSAAGTGAEASPEFVEQALPLLRTILGIGS